jgi:hypothetical protein
MDDIFDNLEKQILKYPKDVKKQCNIAKEQLENLLSQQNYNIFEHIIKDMNLVDTEE